MAAGVAVAAVAAGVAVAAVAAGVAVVAVAAVPDVATVALLDLFRKEHESVNSLNNYGTQKKMF